MDGGATTERVYRALFVFCGVGGGALGFQRASAEFRQLGITARFEVIGGIELDESTARDFSRLTGAPCLVADVADLTPAFLRDVFGEVPDVVFFSPPCKQASGLLAKDIAASEKYVAMGALAGVFCDLMFAAWPTGPRLLLMENVPRITTRAPEVMAKVRKVLRAHRYLIHEEAHDLGELGGLAQHRDRLLLVGRRSDVSALLYQPTKRRVRSVGEALSALPLPGDPRAGRLHRLPAIEAITALRLALIPAGGDWRDLPERVMLPPELAALIGKGRKRVAPSKRTPFNDVYRVVRWDDPAPCVTAGASPSAGGITIADPRPAGADPYKRYGNNWRVEQWGAAAHCIIGASDIQNGAPSIADPRTVRPSHPHTYGVLPWDGPAHTVTGNMVPGGGPFSVADPRVTCKTRENSGIYGVIPFDAPAGTVVGHACHDNGRFSVADPRWPQSVPFPVILSTDGTWHRPLTTLECAALQGFDALDAAGVPFDLDGPMGACRVKIGDAVPVGAAQAIARQMLLTLVYADAGSFALSSGGGVWVREREGQALQ